MKLIPLTQGKFAMVDDEDYDFLNQFHWSVGSGGYPQRAVKTEKGWRPKRMHRDLLNYTTEANVMADHINGDRLDHRRSNLRLVSKAKNQQNQGKRSRKASSRFKGVYWASDIKRWRAYISPCTRSMRRQSLGCYTDEVSAAKAYDAAALKWWGEHARLNFPCPS